MIPALMKNQIGTISIGLNILMQVLGINGFPNFMGHLTGSLIRQDRKLMHKKLFIIS